MSDQDAQVQALGILIEGVKKAFAKGVYTFEESGQLYNAVGTFLRNDDATHRDTKAPAQVEVTGDDAQARKRGRLSKSDA